MPSSYDDVRQFMETELSTKYTDTPVEYDNLATNAHTAAWVNATISTGFGANSLISGQSTLGSRVKMIHTGFMSFDIYTPKNTGTAASYALAQKIEDIFRNRRSGDITTHDMELRRAGELDNFFHHILEIEFRREYFPD